ncbi:MAG: asparagine synthase (glutamine-hydrolyzing) [Bacteroidetes bacterium]|nr:asparagine synthase (glutamine-hydrolyzing) [Bacteroidota bacterium]
MCGIAGFLNYDYRHDYFRKVNRIQIHRGPDHQGTWFAGPVALFHQRLSIIDLSEKANQPFEKEGLVIIYNGEIYNYPELRKELKESRGINFITHSDTEVILELYRIHGEGCLRLLRGMYAFAIVDIQKKSLFLARDPLGIKPLFYASQGEKFAFASELKTLVSSPDFSKKINTYALAGSMNYLWVPGNDCIFGGCNKLPAGHFLKADHNGNTQIQQYYQPDTRIEDYDEEELIDLLDHQISDSVNKHMVADVPVSAFLSGGLDSSLISVLARNKGPLTTYTIKIAGKDKKAEQMPDDSLFARKVAKKFDLDHHEIEISPEITRELPHIIYHLDEPLGDPAAINTYLICKAAKENGSKVLLSGMGADELFFGYRRQKALLLALKYRKIPKSIRKIVSSGLQYMPVKIGNRGIKPVRWAKRFESFANLPEPDAYMRSYSYYDEDALDSLFVEDMSNEINQLYNDHRQIFHSLSDKDVINRMCYTDMQMFMQGLNLTYTDRASMAASVEVRVPFIDTHVVKLAMSIPGEMKFKKQESKYILKKVAERYLPHEVVYRPKASFGAPIRSWISGDLREMVDDLLSEENSKKRGIFNPIFVKDLIKSDRNGSKDNAYQIYHLLTIELWFQEFVDK